MRYFLAFLAAIGLLIILIIVLVSGGGGGGGSKVPTTKKPLTSYATADSQVRLTIDGPINAQQEHKQIVITVGQSQTNYQQVTGYDGAVVKQQAFANTASGYSVFLHALQHAGFTRGDTAPELKDERGYCPQNNRYIFELIQNDKDVQRFWATDCGKPKTYLGGLGLTLSLFKAQVPGYTSLTQGVNL